MVTRFASCQFILMWASIPTISSSTILVVSSRMFLPSTTDIRKAPGFSCGCGANMHSRRALIDITERNTNLFCACIAMSSGVDFTNIGITLRSITSMSIVIWCLARRRGPAAGLQVSYDPDDRRLSMMLASHVLGCGPPSAAGRGEHISHISHSGRRFLGPMKRNLFSQGVGILVFLSSI